MRQSLHLLVFTVGVFPVVSACAASAPVAPPVAPPRPVVHVPLTGMILNGVTSRPLEGAIIDLDDRQGRSQTGTNGRFRVENVTPGMHLLTARAPRFRSRIQPVKIREPDPDADVDNGPQNDFIVFLFAPSGYFDTFPRLGDTLRCRSDEDCPSKQICLMNNFREVDAPTCAVPVPCGSEADCKVGQQCEPVTLRTNEEVRVCQGQPAPEVEP